ncbi:MAG: ATP-binding cassette domain-containing protein, partial [Elusimicrobiota bacterium]
LPGETIGITGPTGSGKTTLINLLPRFYEPLSGKIYIDGVNVQNIQLDSLRKTIKTVFQETLLFSTTVSENIAYGQPDASKEDIENCASLSQAADFINGFEKKYDTVIGERGVTLSGGQKQRVSIARAVLPKPKILLLDNLTSNLDSEVERIVMENILKLKVTTVIVSQKMNVLRKADRIYVLEDGKITVFGSHQELINKEGFYKEIYEEQVLLK